MREQDLLGTIELTNGATIEDNRVKKWEDTAPNAIT